MTAANNQPDDLPIPHVVKLTPTNADAIAECGLRHYRTKVRHEFPSSPSPALQRGITVHRGLAIFNRMYMRDGVIPDIDDLVGGLWPPGPHVTAELEQTVDFTRRCLHGYAQYLQFWHLAPRAVEQFIPIPPRRLATNPNQAILIAGKIDVVLEAQESDPGCAAGTLIACDYKTGSVLPLHQEMVEIPSTLLYHLLTSYWYPEAQVQVMRILPHLGDYVRMHLSHAHIEAGRARIRALVGTIIEQGYVATPGEHCGTCPCVDSCPAHRRPDNEEEF